MRNFLFLTLLTIVIFSSCKQPTSRNYNSLIAEAQELYDAGEFEYSGEKFSEAFEILEANDSILHRYEAARAHALAKQKDKAFEQLFWISNKGNFTDLGRISTEEAFSSLRTDERWMSILIKVSENKKKGKSRLAGVASLLDTVYTDDQKYRQELGEIQEKFGHGSKELKKHWEIINRQDSLNLVKVEQVLEEHGWLGTDLVGRKANSALFLVIQHADLDTQEKYLPMLREAVKKGAAGPSDLALLEDRVALKQGKKQIYGSQIGRNQETGEYYVSPLIDPHNVNQRRAEVGLGPIEGYVANWNLTWDAEAYIKGKYSEIKRKD